MAYQGTTNIQKQLEIQGEYSNPDQEALFDWISTRTKSGECFFRREVLRIKFLYLMNGHSYGSYLIFHYSPMFL